MPNIGLGYDRPLLEWLDTYTFPLESKYGNDEFAASVYEKVVVSGHRTVNILRWKILKTKQFIAKNNTLGYDNGLLFCNESCEWIVYLSTEGGESRATSICGKSFVELLLSGLLCVSKRFERFVFV